MDSFQVNMQAKFDQINACHRDALAASWRLCESLFRLTPDEQRQIVQDMYPFQRELLLVLAEESGNQRLTNLLKDGK